jgi:hypothetical protein
LVSDEQTGLTGQNLWLRKKAKEKTFGLNAKNAVTETIARA